MKYIFAIVFLLSAGLSKAEFSMRRCTLLPVNDSVGGAIGYKVFEEVEKELKKSNWCTYVSSSGMMSIFSRYRENLPQYLKTKGVLETVASKLGVGSLILVNLKHEINGVDASITVFAENGEDIYFSENLLVPKDDIESLSQTVAAWLDIYSKMIPYDAKVTGILGEQITLDVGKGYPIEVGQSFIVKRPVQKKKHPLLKKIVDWETITLGDGKIFNISDNQALGMVKISQEKIETGDWIRLGDKPQIHQNEKEEKKEEDPGTLGVISAALFGSSSSVNTGTASGNIRMGGSLLGFMYRLEGWITKHYFVGLELERSLGMMKEKSGNPTKDNITTTSGVIKVTGGYKYLPIGFFYGPQIDVYTGWASFSSDLDISQVDGFGRTTITGLLLGLTANVPISREFKFFANAEFLPLPTVKDEDDIYGSVNRVNAMEVEIGLRYNHTKRITFDGSLEVLSRKATFDGDNKEISFMDNRIKTGVSFNF
jgi:hypothetical protein